MLLSIIIPVYNTNPEYIQDCLDSSSNPFWKYEYEVIIVNDGSTSEDTIRFIQNLHSSNYLIIQQENKGLGGARNTGIKQAKDRYILPLDSDDKINAEIDYFIAAIHNNSNADVLYGNVYIFSDREFIVKMNEFHHFELFFSGNQLCAGSIFKRNLWNEVHGYDESFATVEDWDFWCRCAAIKTKFEYLPHCIYYYRIVNNGQSLLQQTCHLIDYVSRKNA